MDPEKPWAGRIAKVVKGMFVVLALDAALSEQVRARDIMLTILGAVAALTVGEIYGSAVEVEFKNRRRLRRSDVGGLLADAFYIALGAVPSLFLFALAGLGAFSSATAASLALWSGIAILAFLGLTADRLSGRRGMRALLHAVEFAVLGGAVLLLKSVFY